MLTYKVTKCRHGRCACKTMGWMETPWKVTRYGATYNAKIVSRWPGQGLALEAALELAGLAEPTGPVLTGFSIDGALGRVSLGVIERLAVKGQPTPISGDATRLAASC